MDQILQMVDVGRLIPVLVGLVILIIAMIKDFNGVAKPLAERAILFVEAELSSVVKDTDKLNAAVQFVIDFLPMPYRLLVPRAMIVAFVQRVFDREFAPDLDLSKKEALVRQIRVETGDIPVGEQGPN